MTKPMSTGTNVVEQSSTPKPDEPACNRPLDRYNSSYTLAMSSLRLTRAAVRATRFAATRPSIQQRGYADVAADKIQLSLTLPHQVCCPASSPHHRLGPSFMRSGTDRSSPPGNLQVYRCVRQICAKLQTAYHDSLHLKTTG